MKKTQENTPKKPGKGDARAEALRANLSKRKEQSRARDTEEKKKQEKK